MKMAEFKVVDPETKPDPLRHNFTNAIQKSNQRALETSFGSEHMLSPTNLRNSTPAIDQIIETQKDNSQMSP